MALFVELAEIMSDTPSRFITLKESVLCSEIQGAIFELYSKGV